MANTVNDVINVIASPDYGIKKIAGTNQEILDILQGTTKSENSIHAIVDDVKTLLQQLVNTEREKKSIEVNSNPSKINQKHIQDILDETKNIRKAIDNLTKAVITKSVKGSNPAIAKLSDKASQKVADAMIKNIEKQNKNGGISSLIEAFNKLKDISLKDIIIGNQKIKFISDIFKNANKNLNISDKKIDKIIKIINSAPEIIISLQKVGRKIDKIIKNNVIEKLNNILVGENSILTLSKALQKNEKLFDKASKTAKSIKELAISLNKTMSKLFLTSLWAKMISDKSIENISSILDKLTTLSIKLTENKKHIKNGAEVAKNATILIGNLLLTSIFLATAAITGLPAILGAKFLDWMVDIIIPITKKLSKNNKQIGKAVGVSIMFVAFTGLMAISSLILSSIAKTGIEAMAGSIFMLGFVALNVITFSLLSKASKLIVKGSIAMALMSLSLIVFGFALGKISDATKNIDWKQVGIIGVLTVELGLCVAALGIPVVSPFILLGSLVIGVMGLSLIAFGSALGKLSDATRNMDLKQVGMIGTLTVELGLCVAALGVPILSGLIVLGSVSLGTMSAALYTFAKSLKIISDIGEVPTKTLHQVLNAMKSVRDFFTNNSIKFKTIVNSIQYRVIMRSFTSGVKNLTQLKKLGSIPTKLVYQTLHAMKSIANYYKENPIESDIIEQSIKYKSMMKPFGSTIGFLNKLNEMGSIPMQLVQQTLSAMKSIANYYTENPIEKKAIKQAKNYKKMMRPFGKTINFLSKLKEMGSIPIQLVHQTLNAMKSIANYYVENPIEKKAIKQAKNYKKMMSPFGKTINFLNKLREMGGIPMQLVHQTLNAMSAIANYYKENPIERKTIKQAKRYKKMLKPFGYTIENISKLKEMGNIPMKFVYQALNAITVITNFYKNIKLSDSIKYKSKSIESIVNNFTHVAEKIQNKLSNLKTIDNTSVTSIVNAFRSIINFLKLDTLNIDQIKNANKNIIILRNLIYTMSRLSNIDKTNLSSIGDTLTNTLNGVSTVDLSTVQAVTNMFNAFNGINKSESILNKFTESVKEFTTTCKNLMDAMNYNTDAINNIDTTGVNGSQTNETKENNIFKINTDSTKQNDGVRIINVDEIAKTIAEKINGTLSVDMPDTQVQLLINGTGGNEWTISRY
jgi:hypothetical protein